MSPAKATAKKPVAKKPTAKPEPRKKTVDVKDVYQALFGFQSEALTLPRNGKGNVNGKAYSYVTLDDLVSGIRPLLDKYGLVFTQAVTSDKLITTIVHAKSGTKLPESDIDLGNPSNMQDYGSRITYARRYALTAILGINAETDVDASGSVATPIAKEASVGASAVPGTATPADEKPFPDNLSEKPAPATAEPVPMNATMSEPFKRAKAAIDTCYSLEALGMLGKQIENSTRLTEAEKKDLINILMARKDVIVFDQQK